MKKRNLILGILLAVTAVFLIESCKKDSPSPINLGTLMIGSIDLNGATSPANVPVNPTITATFSNDVDAATAIASNISLIEDYDTLSIALYLPEQSSIQVPHFIHFSVSMECMCFFVPETAPTGHDLRHNMHPSHFSSTTV